MGLLYGWDITVPKPGSVESPDSAAEKWLDNFCYLEGALGVSAASGGSSGGHHVFPGVYGDTAGKHIPGRSALTYVSASTEEPTGVPNSVWFDTSHVAFFYYHATSGWTEAVDFFPASLPASVLHNMSFDGYGGSVDGRNYAVDGAKIDGMTEEARHMVVETGIAGSGDILPWARDRSYVAASGDNLIINGEFGYYPDQYTKLLASFDESGHYGTTFTDQTSANHIISCSANPASQISVWNRADCYIYEFGTASLYVPGADLGNFVRVPDSADWNFGNNELTIDFRIRFYKWQDTDVIDSIIIQQYDDANNYWRLYLHDYAGGGKSWMFRAVSGGAVKVNLGGTSWSSSQLNTWYHIAITRSWNAGAGSGIWKAWIDGDDSSSYQYFSASGLPDLSAPITIGDSSIVGEYPNFWIDELRISNGICRWTTTTASFETFDVPASAYKYDGGGMVTNYMWNTGNDAMLTTVSGGYAGSCAKVVNASTDSHIYQDVSDIIPGGSYRYSYYVRSGSAIIEGSASYYTTFHGLYNIDNADWIVTFTEVSAASVWTRITQDFIAPGGCSAVRIHLGASSASATSYFDSVELYRRVYPEIRSASTYHEVSNTDDDSSLVYVTGNGSDLFYTDLNTIGVGIAWAGGAAPYYNYFGFVLFRSLNIPKGAIIESAYMRLFSDTAVVTNAASGRVYLANWADPSPPGSIDEAKAVSWWSTYVSYPDRSFPNNEWINSPDISALVKYHVDKVDYDPSSNIMFKIQGLYLSDPGVKMTTAVFKSSDAIGSYAPTLHITYTTSAGQPVKIAESYASVISVRAASVVNENYTMRPLECYLAEYNGYYRRVVCRFFNYGGSGYLPATCNYMTIATLALEEGDIT